MSQDTPAPTKAELIEEKYAHLKGVGITISRAAEKYGVPRTVIEDWVYYSHNVHFVDESSYPKLVDEAEVAVCADIYEARKQAGGLTGFPYFDHENRLVAGPKHPHRSRRSQKQPAP